MQQVIVWLPQLVVTSIPGLVNVWLSGGEQRKEFQQKLPIFKPSRSPIWWLLQLVHFWVPALLFWWVAPTIFRIPPPTLTRALNFELWANALAFGWGFVALLNAPISILSAGMLEPGTMYTKLVKNLYEAIDNNEQPKMRRFRRELEVELAQTPNFSEKGFNDLSECLKIPYNFLSEGESTLAADKAALVRKIRAIQDPQKTQAQKAEEIVKLLRTAEVLATQDWPELIRAFGGRETFIRRYFKVRAKTPKKGSRLGR
jgi:hypothetical protein